MNKPTKPLLTFKIKPTPKSRLYYTVKIFDSKKSLNFYADTYKLVFDRSGGVTGLCTIFGTNSNECGEVLLVNGHLGPRVVAHEVSHAMYSMKRRKCVGDLKFVGGEPTNIPDEEWCVDAVGQMVERCYHEINKAGLTQ